MAYTINHYITDWVEESRALMQPDKVLWIDGTETQLEELRREAYITGELIKLNQEKLPGCVYHRSALNDVARVEGRTFICCKKEEDAGPTNNWMAPDEMKAKLHDIYAGCMRGRTMYVTPLLDGCDRLSLCQIRHRDHRLDLRCLLHGDHDARRHEGL